MVGGDPDSRVFQEWIKAYCSIFGENVHPFACHFDVHQGMRVPIAIAPPPQGGQSQVWAEGVKGFFAGFGATAMRILATCVGRRCASPCLMNWV